MNVAIITPKKNICTYAHLTRFHMFVPDHFEDDEEGTKRNQVRKLRVQRHYIILDNGAYERGEPLAAAQLLALADNIKANEIVVPDSMRNADRTLQIIHDFMIKYESGIKPFKFRLMIVPQGRNFKEWLECLHVLQSKHLFVGKMKQIVWGIPKWLSGEVNRLEKLNFNEIPLINELTGERYIYHMLGLMDVRELEYGDPLRTVRGIDTSLPIRKAICGQYVSEINPVIKDVNYFDYPVSIAQEERMALNVLSFLRSVPDFEQYRSAA